MTGRRVRYALVPPRPMSRTKAAHAWVAARRAGENRAATWFDVADAYDAGLRHAVERRQHARRQLAAIDAPEVP